MTANRNPQAEQMADESMVRNLDAQATAIWPQEKPLFERYALPSGARVLDLACGTGEITMRLAELLPQASLLGVDLIDAHLNTARARCGRFGSRVRFDNADAFDLPFGPEFDLVVNRHMLQAVPDADKVVAQAVKVLKPGGRVHIVAEDYSMMHFWPCATDTDEFWRLGPVTYARNTGSDLRSGRKVFTWLCDLGLRGVRVDYVVVDTTRVARDVFSRIWTAWRDGYTDVIARHTTLTRQQVWGGWNDMIAAIENPRGYACWQLPVITGIKP
jgi:SAM-dependent methyltransferase